MCHRGGRATAVATLEFVFFAAIITAAQSIGKATIIMTHHTACNATHHHPASRKDFLPLDDLRRLPAKVLLEA